MRSLAAAFRLAGLELLARRRRILALLVSAGYLLYIALLSAGYYYNLTGHEPDQSFRTLGNNRTPFPDDWPFMGSVVAAKRPPHPHLPNLITERIRMRESRQARDWPRDPCAWRSPPRAASVGPGPFLHADVLRLHRRAFLDDGAGPGGIRWSAAPGAGVLALVVPLLVLQPDFGQTMLIALVWGALFFIAGMPP